MGAQRARAMKSGSGAFDIDDFITKLISYMGGIPTPGAIDDEEDEDTEVSRDIEDNLPLDWDKIGRKAMGKSRRVPFLNFMSVIGESLFKNLLLTRIFKRLGPLSIEQKVRQAVKRAKFEKNAADERKPQEIKAADMGSNENETSKNVAAIKKLLDNIAGPVNLFKFVINPNDFAQSVENLFYLSFLIRDATCALDIDKDSLEPQICLYTFKFDFFFVTH